MGSGDRAEQEFKTAREAQSEELEKLRRQAQMGDEKAAEELHKKSQMFDRLRGLN